MTNVRSITSAPSLRERKPTPLQLVQQARDERAAVRALYPRRVDSPVDPRMPVRWGSVVPDEPKGAA